jgi:heptosyltransferase I
VGRVEPDLRAVTDVPADSRSVLFVLLGSLGDIVRALPLLSILRQNEPRARITWVVDSRWRELAAAHPAVDRLVVFPRTRTPAALARFLRELRSDRYDLALDLQRILKSGICSWVSGAPTRIGFNPRDTKERNHWFNNEWIAAYPPTESKLRHYLAFAERLGLPLPGTLSFGLDSLSDARRLPADVGRVAQNYVAVVMGSSWPSKDWSVDGYRDLVGQIVHMSTSAAVLVGASSHRALAGRVCANVGDPRVVNTVGCTSLAEMAAILGAARVGVGPDTGAGHVAAAMGTPYITLMGPTPASRVAP